MRRLVIGLIAIIASTQVAEAKIHRSTAAKHAFKRQTPCPATGLPRGKCSGWIIDHITPLCAGGADSSSNMQWQTLQESKVKDREERRYCRALKQQFVNQEDAK